MTYLETEPRDSGQYKLLNHHRANVLMEKRNPHQVNAAQAFFGILVFGIRNTVPHRSGVAGLLGNVFGVVGHTLLPPYPTYAPF